MRELVPELSVGWSTDDTVVDAFRSTSAALFGTEAAVKSGVLLGRDSRSVGMARDGTVRHATAREYYMDGRKPAHLPQFKRPWQTGDVIGVAIDCDQAEGPVAYFGIDGVWLKKGVRLDKGLAPFLP